MSGIRVTSYQGVDPRRFIAGFLAGISIVLFLLLIFALLVFTGGFWETLRDVSFQIRSCLSRLRIRLETKLFPWDIDIAPAIPSSWLCCILAM